jgi:hypothetical protein
MPIMLDSDFGGRWRVEGVGCKVERRGKKTSAETALVWVREYVGRD